VLVAQVQLVEQDKLAVPEVRAVRQDSEVRRIPEVSWV
jgi:hypothetical protein